MLDMGSAVADEVVAMAGKGAQGADLLRMFLII
jgi:hypothetical protein